MHYLLSILLAVIISAGPNLQNINFSDMMSSPVECGQTITGAVRTPNGNQITFEGSPDTMVTIMMTGLDGFDTYLELYDPYGSLITSNDDYTSSDAGIQATLTTSGTYKIVAKGFGGSLGSYSLSMNCATAGSIVCDQTVNGSTTSANGDRWIFSGTSGSFVTISMTSDSIDTYLELYDSAGSMIASNDDSSGSNSMIQTILPSSSSYTIVATGYGGDTGPYSMTLDCSSAGASTGGGTLSCGQQADGTTTNSTGDLWTFDGTSGSTVTISMTGYSYDTYLELYGPSGNLVTENDDTNGSDSQIQTTLPSSGTYTIKARGYSGATGSYSLTLDCSGSSRSTSPGQDSLGALSCGQSASNTLSSNSTGDNYSFNGSSGSSVTIVLTGINNFDTYLELYGPSGNLIDSNDDSTGLSSMIVTTLPSSGEYTINANGYGGSTGTYTLTLICP